MTGRVCLVTGGTSGIGRACAAGLAARGATVVIAGRSLERCEATARAIGEESGCGPLDYLCGDLSSQAEVRRIARAFLRRHDRLHVLVNNAGALFERRQESVDGIELTLALNHLGPFLLTGLLLDALRSSVPSRIVNVSSDSHELVAGFDFDDPQALRRRPPYGRSAPASALWTIVLPWKHPALIQYAHSKLANLLFTRELSRRLEGTGVTVNALHPGFVATGFARENGVYGGFMRFWSRLLAKSVEEGAATPVYLAVSPEVERFSGEYFVKQQTATPSAGARDSTASERLWRLSEELVGLNWE